MSSANANANNLNQQQQQPLAVIKRAQHSSKLAGVLHDMLHRGSLVDVTIYCDDGHIDAHKLVLAASSTYFRNLFSRMTNAFHYPMIVLREIPTEDLRTIIEFIYHGEVNVPQNRVDSLMRCANYLQIDGMASSANSLNAILASSSASMSHHALLAPHSTGPISAASSANNIASVPLNKLSHSQYTPGICGPPLASSNAGANAANSGSSGGSKQSRGQAAGRAHHSSSNSTNNNSSSSRSSNHSNRHTCPICLKTFTHGFTLKRHMKLHSQSRHTIYCDVCSKSYSCKDSYLRHKKSSGHLQHAEFHHRSIDMNMGSNR